MLSLGQYKLAFLSITVCSVVGACAHHPDVRPGESNVHTVITVEENEKLATQDAIRQAKSFCKRENKTPVVVSEETKFTGEMDEDEYKKAKFASKAAGIVGGFAWIFGEGRQKDAGKAVTVGGALGEAALGEDYKTEMTFRCQ